MKLLKDDTENYDEYDESGAKVIRDIVKARLAGRVVVCTLPPELRAQLGIVAGTRLMVTIIDSGVDLQESLRDGKKGILVTKE